MRLLASVGLLALLVVSAVSPLTADDDGLLHEHPTLQRMLTRSNELRKQIGLRPHRISPELTQAAQDHANYMARTGVFDHYANGGPFGRALRYRFFGGGVRENIAVGQGSVPGVFTTWQNSGGHWASIVSNTTDAGFGYAVGSGGTPYWVAVYGNAAAKPEPKSGDDESTAEGDAAKTPATAEAPKPTQPAPAQTYTTGNSSGRRILFRRR